MLKKSLSFVLGGLSLDKESPNLCHFVLPFRPKDKDFSRFIHTCALPAVALLSAACRSTRHPIHMDDILVHFEGLFDLSGPLPGTGFQDSLVPVGGNPALHTHVTRGYGRMSPAVFLWSLLRVLAANFERACVI